jgi:cyanophycinase-like exopeptidase
MRPYAIYINESALGSAPRAGAARERLMRFIRSLADNPHTLGDFSEKDDAGRTVQVKIIGHHAVTFWADHAVSEIKVTHIKPAD